MNKMIIGLCGPAGSGKDTIADYLVSKRGFVKMANADLLKRVARDVFDFSNEQLWGSSELRNAPDPRYPREHGPFTKDRKCRCCGAQAEIDTTTAYELFVPKDAPRCALTPRFALQSLGTEWGRMCFDNIWVGRLLGLAQELQAGGCSYDQKKGIQRWGGTKELISMTSNIDVVITDVRFLNEVNAIKSAGGKVVRVVRGMIDLYDQHPTEGGWISNSPSVLLQEQTSISQAVAAHTSETELLTIPREKFDYVFQNSGDLHFLRMQADRMMDVLEKRIIPFDHNLQDAPPFLRDKCKELARAMQGAAQVFGSCEGAWVDGAEVLLWTDLQAAIDRRKNEPDATLSAYETSLMNLKELSDAANGWFSWQNKTFDAPYFVPRGRWLTEYAARRA